jgi:predicted nucleic acid-binding protein
MSATEAFFDTNILLYLMSSDSAKANRAEEIIALGGTISVQVLNEFASTAIRKLGMEVGDIRRILSTIRRVCTVNPLDVDTHDLGLDLVERYAFPVYDGLIVAAAIRAKCRTLYTEDLQHGQRIGGLVIRNPFVP